MDCHWKTLYLAPFLPFLPYFPKVAVPCTCIRGKWKFSLPVDKIGSDGCWLLCGKCDIDSVTLEKITWDMTTRLVPRRLDHFQIWKSIGRVQKGGHFVSLPPVSENCNLSKIPVILWCISLFFRHRRSEEPSFQSCPIIWGLK